QGDRDGGVVELKRAQQADVEGSEFVIAEPEVEPLRQRRDSFVADPDLVANEKRRDGAMAIIFDQMGSQASAILAIDDGATGCAGVALVGSDQFKRMAEQFDMFIVDRSY